MTIAPHKDHVLQIVNGLLDKDNMKREGIDSTRLDLTDLKEALKEVLLVPGDYKWSAVSATPTGWLKCEGQAISRTTYAELFAAISTTYGIGDGSTTFNLPDQQGRALYAVGTHADVNALTDNDAALVANRTPKHTHTVSAPSGEVSTAGGILGVSTNAHTHTTGSTGPSYGVGNLFIKT